MLSSTLLFLALMGFTPNVHAEVGAVSPQEWGARFDPAAVRRAVFCVAKKSGSDCATAFLISGSGYVLTASHVEPSDKPGGKLDWTPGPLSQQTLTDWKGSQLHFRVVKRPTESDTDKEFVKDPAKLMRIRFQIQFYGMPADFNILNEINPDAFNQMDAILLKVTDEDMHILKEDGISPLPLGSASLKKGDRLFAPGYPWEHYPSSIFAPLKKLIEAGGKRSELRNTNGGFVFLTGNFDRLQGRSVVSQASPEQIAGKDADTDAIDSYWGSSGSPILDQEGRVVGVLWGGDNTAIGWPQKAIITFATSIDEIRQLFKLEDIGL